MKRLHPTTKLERVVARWIREQAHDGYDTAVFDLMQHGCVSGMVSELVYYTDTTKFYRKHKAEIHALLQELRESTGLSLEELFGDKWDKDDPFAEADLNQNLLAWFGFEETARNLVEREGIEV